jgi:hypothetical protein
VTRRTAFLFVLLACGCEGRQGVYVVSEGGPPPEAAPESGGGGATDAGTDAPAEAEAGLGTACIDSCNTALSIGCAQDEMNACLAGCSDYVAQFPLCMSQINAENACAAAQPENHWFCDVDGFATLHASYCAAEHSATQGCLSKNYP